ncbi:unnamed protein product [Lactuca virosa]|uniref:Uncharacterized protein n=1 Tax=Lactuca virosa TaxID=75947 RepID=A0AAU9PWI5_9ASTR|nr:unnamed protein product [Lactuca virosa]
MKILSSNDSEDWLLIRMKEMMKQKMMNRFHKHNSSSASYVDFKSGEKLDFKFSTLQALQDMFMMRRLNDHDRDGVVVGGFNYQDGSGGIVYVICNNYLEENTKNGDICIQGKEKDGR